jgi:DNA invertase Pin-like site-specific DNA recombinase
VSETIAASYERVSTRNQGRYGFSLGGQDQSLADFCAAQGWRLHDNLRFRDGEMTAASGADWNLPGLTAMLDAAKRQEFSILAVYDLDRFACVFRSI